MTRETILSTIKNGIKLSEYISPHLSGKIAAEVFLRPQRPRRPEWEFDLLRMATKTYILYGMKVWQFGDFERKVLLVHGWDGRGSQLGKFIQPLLAQGISVICFDGPAHGDSEGSKTNMRHFSEKILFLEEELGPIEGIIAHSFGSGATILALAKGLETKKVVLIGGPSNIPAVFARYSETFELSESTRKNFYRYVEAEVKIKVEDINLLKIVKTLTTNALIIHSTDDKDVPVEESQNLHSAWPGSQLIMPIDLGHRRLLKDPTVIEQAVRFLA